MVVCFSKQLVSGTMNLNGAIDSTRDCIYSIRGLLGGLCVGKFSICTNDVSDILKNLRVDILLFTSVSFK